MDVDINPPTLPVEKMQLVQSRRGREYVRADHFQYSIPDNVKSEPEFDGSNTQH